jgi:hypothetical protein
VSHYWIEYKTFRIFANSLIRDKVRVGPFVSRDTAQQALITLCDQPHFQGGSITEEEPKEEVDT